MSEQNNYLKIKNNVLSLINAEIENGQTIYNLSQYKNLNLWWFCHYDFVENLLKLDESKTESKAKNVKFQFFINSIPTFLFSFINILFDIIRYAVSHLWAREAELAKSCNRKNILFVSKDTMWRDKYDWLKKTSRRTDIFFDGIIDAESKSNSKKLNFTGTYPLIIYIYPFNKILRACRITKEKTSSEAFDYVPFNYYWNIAAMKKERCARKHFKGVWKKLSQSSVMNQMLEEYDFDIRTVIRNKFKFYFLALFPYVIKRTAIANNLLASMKPELTLYNNEYNTFERSLLIASKQQGVPTAVIQHGEITPSHQGYMYVQDMIDAGGKPGSINCPIPDRTFVWGEHYKKLLVAGGYPAETIEITGSPKYDEMVDIKKNQDKEAVLREYNIDNRGRKIILWTTQCLGLVDEENIRNFEAVKAVANSLDALILIKQHPREATKYDEMIARYLLPHPNIQVLPKNAHTLSIINISDIVITKFSTTAIEALAFDKNLIIMNLSTSEPDKVNYVKDGVALGAYNSQQLIDSVKQFMKNKNCLRDRREGYVENLLYKMDGNASERIAAAINQLLETV